MRSQIPLLPWVQISPQNSHGIQFDPNMLHWKWHISQRALSPSSRVPTMLSEEICDMSVSPPMAIGTPVYKPVGSWGPGYSIDIENAWFTDGFSVTKGNKLQWKAAAFCPRHKKIIAKEGVDVFA